MVSQRGEMRVVCTQGNTGVCMDFNAWGGGEGNDNNDG